MAVRVNYCVYREGLSPVFASQVVRPAERVRELGLSVGLTLLVSVGQLLRPGLARRWHERWSWLRKSLGESPCLIPSPPARSRWLWPEDQVLQAWLRFRYRAKTPVILHCRGTEMTSIALAARRSLSGIKVIFDCRGISHAEIEYVVRSQQLSRMDQHQLDARVKLHRQMELSALQEADAVVCVSEAMSGYLATEHGTPNSRITTIPCSVETGPFCNASANREQIRHELGLSERLVVAYCGSLHAWQLPGTSLDLFCSVKQIDPTAHFLAITTNANSMKHMIAAHGIQKEDASVVSIPHDRVPSYLAAADVGLLLREASLLNRVSSPVKFGEYLAAGIPVVMSEGIGDYSMLAESERVGMVIDMRSLQHPEKIAAAVCGFVQQCRREGEALRSRCRAVARQQLSWDAHLPKLVRLYEALAS
ncbi:glycosyltransferase [Syntrophobacter fumaroxidans]|uniref:Glycosyltransferase-like n=1 Tax=Syntrophobacter fumaroxidans (strain DSM 10017 / MPOB) TaxID=335543 RepID=A0LNL7_SYNFM|nr:glycosyltransferase [Syntrophobacter fumaroxidans]ABK19019.1 Glycosyltransferase-like [Syntrophobacter fumaroxidans MPOB]